jgi:hypothetical protein
MSTTHDADDADSGQYRWEPEREPDAPEHVPAELTLDGETHTPEEAGYGYGV